MKPPIPPEKLPLEPHIRWSGNLHINVQRVANGYIMAVDDGLFNRTEIYTDMDEIVNRVTKILKGENGL